jgi:hypothetical protein
VRLEGAYLAAAETSAPSKLKLRDRVSELKRAEIAGKGLEVVARGAGIVATTVGGGTIVNDQLYEEAAPVRFTTPTLTVWAPEGSTGAE